MNEVYQQASELFKANKIPESTKLFEEIVKLDPTNADAKYKLGICKFRLKDYDTSEKMFRTIVSETPGNYNAWYYLGLSLERQGKSDESISVYKIALSLKPDFEAAKKKLGIEIEEKGPSDSAVFTSDSAEGPGQVLYSTGHQRIGSFTKHWAIIIVLILIALGFMILIAIINDQDLTVIPLMALVLTLLPFIDLVVKSRFTSYIIYERRIDIKRGILFRKHKSFWLFEIKNISFTRSPLNILFMDSRITIDAESDIFYLTGLSSPKTGARMKSIKFSEVLFEELRNSVREQRGEVKKIWI